MNPLAPPWPRLPQLCIALGVAIALWCITEQPGQSQVLDKQAVLQRQTFWDNRDMDWYIANIPFFECPDPELETTYYYRWELITKHLTYGSPDSGYLFTEFIDRPFWSGAYGAISCPAGHQLYEARWLRSPRVAFDYSKYWLKTPGAQPRNYSTWLADSVVAIDAVHPDPAHCSMLLNGLINNFEQWKARHYDANVGMFWQTGHDDGMEFNIASRQTQDILRGAPSYRPSFNAYMWADARAIAELARREGRSEVARQYSDFADALRKTVLAELWDPKRQFFFPMFKNKETRDGHEIPAGTLTYQAGQYAGDTHGRELIGYVPWQFGMLQGLHEYDKVWEKLMDRDGFYANYGPCTVERNDPMFLLQKSCCWWSGQSWPYATTQTLKALANRLQESPLQETAPKSISAKDYVRSLQIYSKSHRKEGRPYLAEALHPDTGSFEGHDAYNHSEHYFHSGFCDLVITGLVGLIPNSEEKLTLHPLAPADWDYFALDGVAYRGRDLCIAWDRTGARYGKGTGLLVWADGILIAQHDSLSPFTMDLPPATDASPISPTGPTDVNHLVNNDGNYFPRVTASSTAPGTSIAKLQDGNYWYLQHPPNRWASAATPPLSASSSNDQPSQVSAESLIVDFGTPRAISTLMLYLLEDEHDAEGSVALPQSIRVSIDDQGSWKQLTLLEGDTIQGHRPTQMDLDATPLSKIRIEMVPRANRTLGLTEIEAWGRNALPYPVAPPPAGNLAYRDARATHPKATASHSDRFGGTPEKANDGKTVFPPTPMNRWTSYESASDTDWLEIDFGKTTSFSRVELAIYDDRGGVQPPKSFHVEYLDEGLWKSVVDETHRPELPAGSQWNEARFRKVTSSKVRVVFQHQLPAKSGVSEIMVWEE